MSEQGFHRVHIRKEALKFSSAHMTVFADGTKEALHGHNYRTRLTADFDSASLDRLVPFRELKDALKVVCREWDEKVLLAARCPKFKIVTEGAAEIEFTLCGKRYVLPRDEVVLLPVDNVITETLSELVCRRVVGALGPKLAGAGVRCLEVRVEEMLGQGASYVWRPQA